MANPINSVPAYPLQWPAGVPRTKNSQVRQSNFGKQNWEVALKELHRELKLLGAQYVTVSTNMPLRQDGKPYAQQRTMDDAGVAVYFSLDGQQVCFPCDKWRSMAENLRAITLHIGAMRGQQRWGVGTAKQAFAGYKALTAVAGEGEDWWVVLGVEQSASIDTIKTVHRELVRKFHPDLGGTQEQMSRINTARDRAIAEKEGK
jgi:hypothetical protein